MDILTKPGAHHNFLNYLKLAPIWMKYVRIVLFGATGSAAGLPEILHVLISWKVFDDRKLSLDVHHTLQKCFDEQK